MTTIAQVAAMFPAKPAASTFPNRRPRVFPHLFVAAACYFVAAFQMLAAGMLEWGSGEWAVFVAIVSAGIVTTVKGCRKSAADAPPAPAAPPVPTPDFAAIFKQVLDASSFPTKPDEVAAMLKQLAELMGKQKAADSGRAFTTPPFPTPKDS